MAGKTPTCSVIVPVRNEWAYIEALIASVESLRYPNESLEVLIVDGASNDGTKTRLLEWARNSERRIVVLDNPQRIVPVALNMAIQKAQGDYIVRLDAHTTYAPDYLEKCVALGEETGADNVGGVVVADVLGKSDKAAAIRLLSRSVLGVGNSKFRTPGTPRGPAETVPFGCFRRGTFEKYGLFNEALIRAQDLEFNKRLLKLGGRIMMDPAICSVYFNRSSMGGLARKNFGSGRWAWAIPYVSIVRPSLRHTLPLFFVASLAVLAAVSLAGWRLWWLLPTAATLYFALLAAGAFWLEKARKVSVILWFVAGCSISHICYGVGSAVGILVTGPLARQRMLDPGRPGKAAIL